MVVEIPLHLVCRVMVLILMGLGVVVGVAQSWEVEVVLHV